jgi:hypothetical protein
VKVQTVPAAHLHTAVPGKTGHRCPLHVGQVIPGNRIKQISSVNHQNVQCVCLVKPKNRIDGGRLSQVLLYFKALRLRKNMPVHMLWSSTELASYDTLHNAGSSIGMHAAIAF